MSRKHDILNPSTDRRDRYEFWRRRAGDTVALATADDRRRIVSAYCRWKASRPGTLKMITRRDGDGYVAEFSGISPAEFRAAIMEGSKNDPI